MYLYIKGVTLDFEIVDSCKIAMNVGYIQMIYALFLIQIEANPVEQS